MRTGAENFSNSLLPFASASRSVTGPHLPPSRPPPSGLGRHHRKPLTMNRPLRIVRISGSLTSAVDLRPQPAPVAPTPSSDRVGPSTVAIDGGGYETGPGAKATLYSAAPNAGPKRFCRGAVG